MSNPFRWLARRLSAPTKPIVRGNPRPIALRCERVEDRTVPAATTVSIAAISDGINDGTPAVFEVDRTGDTSSYLTVYVLMSGTADFYTMSQVGIPAGDSSAELDAVPVSGGAAGSVDVTLEDNPDAYDIASPGGTATAAIFDSAPGTKATFTLNGSDGSIRYDIPWASVDSSQASQSLALSNFAIDIAGQTLTPSNADFTTSPTAQFAYGVLTGITFAIDTSGISGFAYTSVSVSGSTLSAVDAITNETVSTTLAGTGSVTIDFNSTTGTVKGGGFIDAGTITITVTTQNNTYTSSVDFTSGISRQALASLVARDLVQQGLKTAKANGTAVEFDGNANDPIASVTVVITNNTAPAGGKSQGITLDIQAR